jgi:putative ABC transport system permease protein
MRSRDLAELAGRNLREAMLRNTLTTLGIAVGVASLVAMLALGAGLQELASKRLTRSGLFDKIFVTSHQNLGAMGRPAPQADPGGGEMRTLDDTARQQIERLADVAEVYPEIHFLTEVEYAGRKHVTTVAGVPASARLSDAFEGMQGTFFSGPEADEIILQMDFARELTSQPIALLGQQLLLRYAERQPLEPAKRSAAGTDSGEFAADFGFGFAVMRCERRLRIVGIVESDPGVGPAGFIRGRIFVPVPLAERLRPVQMTDLRGIMRSSSAGAAVNYSSLVVRVGNPKQVAAVEDAVKQMGFVTFSLLDMTRNLRRLFVILDLFLGIFGSLALAVASLSIINTLVMAILERRREIGILKALGAADRDVRQMFFAEAGAMGLVGGALGVAMGWTIGRVINFGTNIYLRRQGLPAENIWWVPWWLVLGAIGFAVLVSLVAGIYPAARAARLDPVQALRYE